MRSCMSDIPVLDEWGGNGQIRCTDVLNSKISLFVNISKSDRKFFDWALYVL